MQTNAPEAVVVIALPEEVPVVHAAGATTAPLNVNETVEVAANPEPVIVTVTAVKRAVDAGLSVMLAEVNEKPEIVIVTSPVAVWPPELEALTKP